jgi:bifunctional non-homologous end joining protein LigD
VSTGAGRCHIIFRNGNPFASFSELAGTIAVSLPSVHDAILDGEIVCLDKARAAPQFNNLLFRCGEPCFFAFDLLWNAGKDHRLDALLDRKQELKRLLSKLPPSVPVRYADHVEGKGVTLFERTCKLDLEGIRCQTQTGTLRHCA